MWKFESFLNVFYLSINNLTDGFIHHCIQKKPLDDLSLIKNTRFGETEFNVQNIYFS